MKPGSQFWIPHRRAPRDRQLPGVRAWVRIVEVTGKPVVQIARDLGVNEGKLGEPGEGGARADRFDRLTVSAPSCSPGFC